MAVRIRFRSLQSLIGLLTILIAGPGARAQTDQSVTFQINPQHTGSVTSPRFHLPLTKRWTLELSGAVSYPIIADGKLFVTHGDSLSHFGWSFEAIDPVSAWPYWGWGVGTQQRISLAYEGGLVYWLTGLGRLYALDPVMIKEKWAVTVKNPDTNTGPPTVLNGTVYFGGEGNMFGVNTVDGSTRWTRPVLGGRYSSPAVTSDALFVNYGGPQIYRIDPATSSVVWRYDSGVTDPWVGRTPALYENILYAPVNDRIWRLDASTGAKLPGEIAARALPAFDSGRIYVAAGAALEARSAATLELLWTYVPPLGDQIDASPIVVNGDVFAGTSAGNILALDGATGALLWADNVGAPITASNEQTISTVQSGLGAGEGLLIVPAGKRLVCYAPADAYLISALHHRVYSGANVTASWNVPPGRRADDWIGLYKVGDPDSAYRWWRYTNGAAIGSELLTAPEPGEYEIRYFAENGYTLKGKSIPFTVIPDGGTFTLTPSPATVLTQDPLRIEFVASQYRPQTDWIGLYRVGDPDTAYLWYRYTEGMTWGGFDLIAPAAPGQYEFRYLLRGGYTRAAVSAPITVRARSGYTLTASPSTVRSGHKINVNWTNPNPSSPWDWVGMYRVGDPAGRFVTWIYIGDQRFGSGKATFTAPATPGPYEFRYFIQNLYIETARSNTVTVQ